MKNLERKIEPELLDCLPPTELRAIRSRRDLARVNWWMGNARRLSAMLRAAAPPGEKLRVVEFGAGDGRFTMELARLVSARWPAVEALLVDRHKLATAHRANRLSRLGWTARWVEADVFEWLENDSTERWDLIFANLFLHHFQEDQLRRLFFRVAQRSACFAACEPRRTRWGRIIPSFLWMIGCNGVTRHDAAISIAAGFERDELARLWPAETDWEVAETDSGLFSHLFCARKRA